ncbi:FhaA domain-containing protein [Pseudarthrobacter sp. J1738]|uniref:FhaA domain-containing protein n=1 Tax=unclassified Pseudarthrobacter TaxID=2647000 RepID=UPI003D288BE7
MGLLDRVERGIEKAVRGVFSTGSRTQVQPVEIASRLRRELDHNALTVSAGRTLAPNVFDVLFSSEDFERAQQWGTALAEELCDVVIKHVRSQGYTLQGPVRVSFLLDENFKPGDFEVESSSEKNDAGPQPSAPSATPRNPAAPRMPAAPTRAPSRLQPVLDINGQRYSLNAPSITLGRSSEADILVDDTGVSRKHLEIRTDAGTSLAVDLGSTNGSYVNGQKLHGSTELTDGSVITMGRTRIIFRLLTVNGAPNQGGGQ